MSAASELGLQWVRNADEQRTLAELALDRQMWNAAVALAAAGVERYLKAVLVADNTLSVPPRLLARCSRR